jgi:cell division protein FtsI (penicillin-binding protein 3)
VLLALAFGGIGARLVMLQVLQYPEFARLAAAQRERDFVFPPHRGAIFDRNGESLGVSVELQTVFTDPSQVENAYEAAAKLSPILRMSRRELEERLTAPNQFQYLARQVSPRKAKTVEALELPGVYVKPEPKRMYPGGRLASQLIGFVNMEGDALEGVELQYDPLLRGRPGRMTLEQDPHGRPLPQAEFVYIPAQPGKSLYLTIDKELQLITENALREAMAAYRAEAASAIIMRPRSGEILAVANMPDFEPSKFAKSTPRDRRNSAIVDNYEPGSAFKLVTASAVLEEGLFKPRSAFSVPDEVQVADRVIHDSHSHPIEDMTLAEIIRDSSNVGTVKLAMELGADKLDEWIRRFGFGSKTGLDFPGEASGIVLDREDWWGSSIGTVPLGQGIAVTPLQMVSAYSALANGGIAVEPKLVHSVMESDGDRQSSPHAGRTRVVSGKTSRRMVKILTDVVHEGTGIRAQIPGYTVAGKTGTAQKPLETGGYGKSYISSFVGFVPAKRPEIAIIVTLDEPRPIWGGSTAAPTFSAIGTAALRYLGVAPSTNTEKAAAEIEQDAAEQPQPYD